MAKTGRHGEDGTGIDWSVGARQAWLGRVEKGGTRQDSARQARQAWTGMACPGEAGRGLAGKEGSGLAWTALHRLGKAGMDRQ